MKLKFLSLLALATLTLYSCDKNDEYTTEEEQQETTEYEEKRVGLYFLSEGGWGAANSKLGYYDIDTETLSTNYFEDKNPGSTLGDTAQDIIVYGSKTYIIVNESDKIIVLNSYTGAVVKEYDLTTLFGETVYPRYAIGAEGKVYVSTWNEGVLAIDTTSFATPTSIPVVGAFSEGIVYHEGNVYVANSGNEGDSYGGYGATISVISTETDTEVDYLDTPLNPNILKMGSDGKMYLSSWGDWWSVDAQLHEIDYVNNSYTTLSDCVSRFAVTDKYIYTSHFSYITYEASYKKIDLSTGEAEDFDVISLGLVSPYNVNSDLSTNTVFYTCQTGKVVMLDEEGNLEKTFSLDDGTSTTSLNTSIVKFVDLTYAK